MISLTITHFDLTASIERFSSLEGFKRIFSNMTFGKPPKMWVMECERCGSSMENGPNSAYRNRVDESVRDTVEFIEQHENCTKTIPKEKVN